MPDPRQDSVVYAVTNAGVFRSADADANWQPVSDSLVPEVVLTVALDSEDSATF